MSVFKSYFPLGLGTSRFAIKNPNDTEAIEKAAELVLKALDAGIDYIDTSYTYSAGAAQSVLEKAFKQTRKPFSVTVKVTSDMDKTADDARRRVEMQLNTMGLQKADFFVCWAVWGYEAFKNIMRPGGIYDGALKMKEEGIIKHICCSIHAPVNEIIEVIKSGAYEGITVSYSLINAASMQPVLDCALKNDVGVAVMNPFGGGLIPQNPDFFSFAANGPDDNIKVSALRFVKAHPAVDIILSGISNEVELYENIGAVGGKDAVPNKGLLKRVLKCTRKLKDFCTGCNYCKDCPKGIPISDIMQKRNRLLMDCKSMYNRTEPALVKNLNLFYQVGVRVPETSENKCIRCGECERKCTQKLHIMDLIADTYNRMESSRFSVSARKERLRELLYDKSYKKVGLYPNGGFASLIMEMYGEIDSTSGFEWLQFNSDPKMWGEKSNDVEIHPPSDIEKLRPDIIIICTYKYDKEIYDDIVKYEDKDIKIVKLHEANDLPWIW